MLREFVGARMAERTRRLPQNIAGDFFVDDSRIDCDTRRQIAPAHFRDHGDHLAWSPAKRALTAFRNVNWYSRPEQTRSAARLRTHRSCRC